MPPRRKGGFNFFAGLDQAEKKQADRKGGKGKNATKPKKQVHPEIAELRTLRKKVREIESLEMSMHQLKPFQKQKIAQKPGFKKRILELEELHPQCKPPVRRGGQKQTPESKFGSPYRQQTQQKTKATVIVLETKSRPTPQQQLKNLTAKSAQARTGNKEKKANEEINCETYTGVKKQLKSIKKSLKKIEGFERQAGLGQVLAKGEKAILESKPDLEIEQKTLKKKRQKMLEQGILTQAEKASLLDKVRKQIISCNEIEEKLMIGDKLSDEEKKILDSKKCYMKEFAHLNSVIPVAEKTAAKVVAKKATTLGDFPKEIQNRLFKIDMELSKLKYEKEEAKVLEVRFNKKGGKPLSPKEVRKVNRIESLEKRIEKLETEQETLIREHS